MLAIRKRFCPTVLTVLCLAVVLLLSGCGQSGQTAYAPMEKITLFTATDLHYLSPELTDHGAYFQEMVRNSDGKTMEYCEEVVDAFVAQVIQESPDALILSGDLTFNGAARSHADLAEKLQRIVDAGIPVLAMPGNHDLDNALAGSFFGEDYVGVDNLTPRQFEELYNPFGLGDAIARDGTTLSYVAELTPALRVLMLDVNSGRFPGELTEETLQWVEEQLQQAATDGIRVVAVSHQNLLQHNKMFSYGYMIDNNEELLSLYETYHVICNLSGHIHMQHITQSEQDFPEIVTSSLEVWPNQYGVLTLEGTSASYHTTPVDVPVPDGAVFSSFFDYSHDFMWDTSYGQATAALKDGDKAQETTEEETDRLARFLADVHTAYFAGRLDTVEQDPDLLQGWEDQGVFFAAYLQSLLEEGTINQTELSFPLP